MGFVTTVHTCVIKQFQLKPTEMQTQNALLLIKLNPNQILIFCIVFVTNGCRQRQTDKLLLSPSPNPYPQRPNSKHKVVPN